MTPRDLTPKAEARLRARGVVTTRVPMSWRHEMVTALSESPIEVSGVRCAVTMVGISADDALWVRFEVQP